MKNDVNATSEERNEKVAIKKQMRQIIKQAEKLHSDWKAMYKTHRKNHWLTHTHIFILSRLT